MVTQPLSTISLLKHIVIARDVQCLKIINYVYIWLIHESVHLHIDLGQLTCILLGHQFSPGLRTPRSQALRPCLESTTLSLLVLRASGLDRITPLAFLSLQLAHRGRLEPL